METTVGAPQNLKGWETLSRDVKSLTGIAPGVNPIKLLWHKVHQK